MAGIERRLVELEGEREELESYTRLDRQRRALEYTLYEHELRKANEHVSAERRGTAKDALRKQAASARAVVIRAA
jgi:structural maintenance of chromosome 3 (chondroitin sulfate proteoglycan 6)